MHYLVFIGNSLTLTYFLWSKHTDHGRPRKPFYYLFHQNTKLLGLISDGLIRIWDQLLPLFKAYIVNNFKDLKCTKQSIPKWDEIWSMPTFVISNFHGDENFCQSRKVFKYLHYLVFIGNLFTLTYSLWSKHTDHGRPRKPFFIKIPNFWAWSVTVI